MGIHHTGVSHFTQKIEDGPVRFQTTPGLSETDNGNLVPFAELCKKVGVESQLLAKNSVFLMSVVSRRIVL